MKKAFSLMALTAGLWLLTLNQQSEPQFTYSGEVQKMDGTPSASSDSIVSTREPTSSPIVSAPVPMEIKYSSPAEEAFFHLQGLRLSESYRIRLYEDVNLTPGEAYSLNQNEDAAEEEIYQLGLVLEKLANPTKEELVRLYWTPRAEIYKRLEQKQIELVGASRFQILQDGKEKYADDRESQFGMRPSTAGW